MRIIFELIPVVLAIISAIVCGHSYRRDRRRRGRMALLVATVCSVLLVIAQLSWWTSYIVQGLSLGTEFADVLWTMFNNLVMVSYIILAWPRKIT